MKGIFVCFAIGFLVLVDDTLAGVIYRNSNRVNSDYDSSSSKKAYAGSSSDSSSNGYDKSSDSSSSERGRQYIDISMPMNFFLQKGKPHGVYGSSSDSDGYGSSASSNSYGSSSDSDSYGSSSSSNSYGSSSRSNSYGSSSSYEYEHNNDVAPVETTPPPPEEV